jgi:SsrA-binding protein
MIVNKRARFEYNILESYQAGLVLSGELIKGLREKRVTLNSAYVVYNKGTLNMIGFKLQDKDFTIKLLLNKKEMNEVIGAIKEKNITCIPINIKRVGRWFKSEIAVAKGKKTYDKKETLKQRDLDRESKKEIY